MAEPQGRSELLNREEYHSAARKLRDSLARTGEYLRDLGVLLERMEADDRRLRTSNTKLLAACEAFVSLFRNSDMQPEDECHELYGQMEVAIAEARNLARPDPGAKDSVHD